MTFYMTSNFYFKFQYQILADCPHRIITKKNNWKAVTALQLSSGGPPLIDPCSACEILQATVAYKHHI